MEQYTTVKQVRKILSAWYKSKHTRLSFTEALGIIENENLVEEYWRFPFVRSLDLLPLERLRTVVDGIPIAMNPIIENKDKLSINENVIIRENRDVLGFVNLPFVGDSLHYHDHFELNFVYNGKATMQLDTETRSLEQWDLCLVAPDFQHSLSVDDEESLVLTYLIRRSSFDNIFGSLLLQDDLLARFFRNTLYKPGHSKYLLFRIGHEEPLLLKSLQNILIESNSLRPYASDFTNCLLHELFYTLLRDHGSKISYYGLEKHAGVQNFSSILLYLQNNYRTATLGTVASFFQYSEGYLSRLFKRNLDMNFTDVIQAIKLRKAKSYLLETDMEIGAICEQVGYESADYFTKCFKKHFNCTPSDFRTRSRLQQASSERS